MKQALRYLPYVLTLIGVFVSMNTKADMWVSPVVKAYYSENREFKLIVTPAMQIRNKVNCIFPINDSTPQIGINCDELYKRLEKSIGFDVISQSSYGSELVIIKEFVRGNDTTRNLKVVKGAHYADAFFKVIEKTPPCNISENFKNGFEYEITYTINVKMEYEMTLNIYWTIRKLKE